MDVRFWSREFIADFINLYKAYPCLWKIKSKSYKNRNLRDNAYLKMVEFCKERGLPDANRDLIVRKIQSLRGSFRKELKKAIENRSCNGNEVYVPSLWYYNLLLFTKDQELPTVSTSNVDDSELYANNLNEGFEGNEDNTEEQKAPSANREINQPDGDTISKPGAQLRKRKRNNLQADFLSICAASLKAGGKEMSEYDAIGVTVAKKLEKMDPIQAIYADSLINCILRRGLLKKLTEDTEFCKGRCKSRTETPSSLLSSEPSPLTTFAQENAEGELRTHCESEQFN